MARGRPTKYDPRHCGAVLRIMKKGGSVVACCAKLGIHKDTFYSWAKEHPEFSDAYRLGMMYAESHWEDVGKKGVLGLDAKLGGESGKVHAGMYSFFMKNRFGWKDRAERDDQNADSGEGHGIQIYIPDNGRATA